MWSSGTRHLLYYPFSLWSWSCDDVTGYWSIYVDPMPTALSSSHLWTTSRGSAESRDFKLWNRHRNRIIGHFIKHLINSRPKWQGNTTRWLWLPRGPLTFFMTSGQAIMKIIHSISLIIRLVCGAELEFIECKPAFCVCRERSIISSSLSQVHSKAKRSIFIIVEHFLLFWCFSCFDRWLLDFLIAMATDRTRRTQTTLRLLRVNAMWKIAKHHFCFCCDIPSGIDQCAMLNQSAKVKDASESSAFAWGHPHSHHLVPSKWLIILINMLASRILHRAYAKPGQPKANRLSDEEKETVFAIRTRCMCHSTLTQRTPIECISTWIHALPPGCIAFRMRTEKYTISATILSILIINRLWQNDWMPWFAKINQWLNCGDAAFECWRKQLVKIMCSSLLFVCLLPIHRRWTKADETAVVQSIRLNRCAIIANVIGISLTFFSSFACIVCWWA